MFNRDVGYCQGMANIVALMLMYLHEEEDVFWALTSLLRGDKYQMNDFFTPKLPKLFRCLDHHLVLRKKFIPSVHKHLKKLHFEPTLYATKWFLQCFLDNVPFSLALRIWDIFLFEGEEIETAMAVAILRCFKKNIVKATDEQVNDFLSRLPRTQVNYISCSLAVLFQNPLLCFETARTGLTFLRYRVIYKYIIQYMVCNLVLL